MDVTIHNLASTPFVEHWLGPWAMREAEFNALAGMVHGLDVASHLAGHGPSAAKAQSDAGPLTMLDGGVAMIEVRGRMQKQQSSLGSAASTVDTRRAIRQAANDPNVGSILMVFDTPGGTVAGTGELASDIEAAGQKKPVVGLCEDLCCSAGFWAASQCSQLFAQKTAIVGSIGTYGVVADYSAAAAKDGVKVHVIRAGQMKGSGTPGTEVTGDQLADLQREINSLNAHFVAGVAAGRKMPADCAEALATGQVWIGQEAVTNGLVDGIANLDQTVALCRGLAQQTLNKMGKSKMSSNSAATYAEIVSACPGADSEFICGELKAGSDIPTATRNFIAHQQLQLESSRQSAAAAEKKAAEAALAITAAQNAPGVKPLASRDVSQETQASGEGSALEQFQALVSAKVAKGMKRHHAASQVVRERPDLQAAVVAESNNRNKAS